MRIQQITIHRPGEILMDAAGNIRRDPTTDQPLYSEPRDMAARAYRVGPVRALEISEGRQTVVTSAAGSFPVGTDVRATDELTADGRRYRVLGVMTVRGATLAHVRADLEAIT